MVYGTSMKTIQYINLTSGVEAIPDMACTTDSHDWPDWHFIRIQSTACEQKRWEFILLDLDNDFLINLALGNKCIIYDFSAHKSIPRSIFQGVEWIRFALTYAWFDKIGKVIIRGKDCTGYFAKELFKIKDGPAIMKLKYYQKFLNTDELKIETVSQRTKHDGDIGFHKGILLEYNR